MNDDNPIQRLTAREREALRLASVHMTSKEIARRLEVSPATVDRHMANAMRKLGAGSRWAAVRMLLEEAVPGPPEGAAENPSTQSSPMATGSAGGQSPPGPPMSGGPEKGPPPWAGSHGLAAVLLKFLVDAVLVTVFFAVLTAGASAAHWIVMQSEAAHVDHTVVVMLKIVHYALVGIDGFGVVVATGLLTFRFLKALKETR